MDPLLSFEERTNLGIGEAVGTPLPDHLVSVVFLQITDHVGSADRPNDSNPLQSNTDRKSTINLAMSMGTTVPFQIKLNSQ